MLNKNRIIHFEGVFNFRDIGGTPAENGRVTASGLLFRSDSPHSLSSLDKKKFDSLQIKTIIDLRTPNERKGKVFTEHAGQNIRIVNIPIYPEPLRADTSSIQRLFAMVLGKYRNFDLVQFMMGFYRRIALEHCGEINRIITLLSERQNLPAVIHCTGGKDRTGWISALIQSVAGVPLDLIFEDYLLSNEFMFSDFKKQQRKFAWFTFFQSDAHGIRPMLEARKEYLNTAIDAALGENATIREYLENTCALPKNSIDRFCGIFCG